jgi:hypothetical protein
MVGGSFIIALCIIVIVYELLSGFAGKSSQSIAQTGRILTPTASTPVTPPNPIHIAIIANPYSVSVLNASGQTVVQDLGPTFTIGSIHDTVANATNIQQSGSTWNADLQLAQTHQTAHALFTLVMPDVLRVQLALNSGGANQISESFSDQGDRYYGILNIPLMDPWTIAVETAICWVSAGHPRMSMLRMHVHLSI